MRCNYYSLILGMSVAMLIQCTIGSIYRFYKSRNLRDFSIVLASVSLLLSCSTYSIHVLFRTAMGNGLFVFVMTGIYCGYFAVSSASVIRFSRNIDSLFLKSALLFCSLAFPFMDWVWNLRTMTGGTHDTYIIAFVNLISAGQLCMGVYQGFTKKAAVMTETVIGSYILNALITLGWQMQYGLYVALEYSPLYYIPLLFLMLSSILLLEASAISVLQKLKKYEHQTRSTVSRTPDPTRASRIAQASKIVNT